MKLKPITIQDIKLHPILLPIVEPIQTSFGVEVHKGAVITEITTDNGITGWGEAAVDQKPTYGAETVVTGFHVLHDFAAPKLIGKTLQSPMEVPTNLHFIRGNRHAKAGIEAAVWDAMAKANEMRIADLFALYTDANHQARDEAVVGVSIGIQPSIDETLAIIGKRLEQGYGRIKLKIQPGWDVEMAGAVRERYPDAMLMLDANSAYTLDDIAYLQQLDTLDLLMIEQPLGHDDLLEHSRLQPQLQTAICLDESVKSVHDLRLALELGACRILNLKPARVGGYTESLLIYNLCVEQEIPLWIGGMLETGIGRAANVAFAALPGVTLPSDISATDRYYKPDISEPSFILNGGSTLSVPDGEGIGVTVERERLEEAVARWQKLGLSE